MKRMLACFCCLLLTGHLTAQTCADYAVRVTVTAQDSPPALLFDWPADGTATSWQVFRKTLGAGTWGTVLATLPGTATGWQDTAVLPGEAWEYRFLKTTPTLTGNGYAWAGLQAPVAEDRGKLILVMDSTWEDSLAPELERLRQDLTGDGWELITHRVDRNDTPPAVKALIVADYTADPAGVKAVFLLGHVPVPYSGNLYPDGHPDHQGAWPADVYYGEMNSGWTDMSVNNTVATRPENDNIPGDGKFDASTLPGDVDLWVGRVDLANLPAYSLTEWQLLRRYLDKDHAWRTGQVQVTPRAVIDDNFGVFGGPPLENFASAGWRLAPLTGSAQQSAGDFLTAATDPGGSLFLYGCGAGTYTSAAGVGTSWDFAADTLRGVFSMIFGSYHGDWDYPDALLRAAIASEGSLLTSAWAGRPQWHLHHMGLGMPIGYSTRISQNNNLTYIANYGARQVHIALMGDPTLRQQIVKPASQFTATPSGTDVLLSWTASPDAVAGYYLYRATRPEGPFTRIHSQPLTATTWTDACPGGGIWYYQVRALKLENGPSGSFWNLSTGIHDTATVQALHLMSGPQNPPPAICPGDTFLLSFDPGSGWCAGNVFTAELSDGSGSFASAISLGTGSGSPLTVVVPPGTPAGQTYQIRIHASAPDTASSGTPSLSVYGPPAAGFTWVANQLSFTFTDTTLYATAWAWDFGDGTGSSTLANPVYSYASPGLYTVTLIITHPCGNDTAQVQVQALGTDRAAASPLPRWDLYPNPGQQVLHVRGEGLEEVILRDMLQREVLRQSVQHGAAILSLPSLPAGVYSVELRGGGAVQVKTWIRE